MHRRATKMLLVGCFAAMTWSSSARATCPAGAGAKLYAEARHAFEEKRYDESVTLLHRAYACDPNPVYLGNVARTLEEARRPKEAIVAWRAYLDVVTDPKDRTQTEGRISALSKMIEELDRLEKDKRDAEEAKRAAEQERARSAGVTALPPAREPPAETKPRVPTGAWIVTGVGA